MENKLVDLTVKGFLDKVAGNDPVPGGGSVSAFYGAVASSLAAMVGGLTIGKKKYAEYNDIMEDTIKCMKAYQQEFLTLIDKDSDAYHKVFNCFKMPKETDEEKAKRSQAIQEGTLYAAEVPLEVAKKALEIMDMIETVVKFGNQNAVTDGCIAMMSARNAVLGAALNVRINLGGLKDTAKAKELENEVVALENQAIAREEKLRTQVTKDLYL